MSLVSAVTRAAEQSPLPDSVLRFGIEFLVGRTRKKLASAPDQHEVDFVQAMTAHAIAEHAETANAQHYELPPEFFALTLGPRRKYSCCLYPTGRETLAEAERLALDETVAHAGLTDGQSILELGCGWGSLTFFMAERFPHSAITAVSYSRSQRLKVEAEAAARGLDNIRVITADMNTFEPDITYDRVVSVEMFEHMTNWRDLLARIRVWLSPHGALFLHIFSHKNVPYRFNEDDDADWIAQHFFTGGIMPSHGLIRHFSECFSVQEEWRWNGLHYQRTACHWLRHFDHNRCEIDAILAEIYGRDAALWGRRWRLFYLATAGLFGHAGGEEWGVSHYLLRPS